MNLHKAEFIRSAAHKKDFIHDGRPQITLAGRSNVGKSSVINRLLDRKNFARVGNAPGKTSHVNYFLIDQKYGTILADQSRELPLENNSAQLTDHMFDNDALVFDHQIDWAGIGYPDGTPYVSLSCPGFTSFGIWAAKGAPFVCLEPWLGRADNYGFTGDLSEKPDINRLEAHKTFHAQYTITIH